MEWEKVIPSIVTGSFTLVAALIVATLTLGFYFRQKEYEVVKKRYLDNGVDQVTSTLYRNLSNLRHNWARSLFLVSQYNTYGKHFDKSDLQVGYLDVFPAEFETVACARVCELTGSDVIWRINQFVLAFIGNSNDAVRYDIPRLLSALDSNAAVEVREKKSELLLEKLREINEKAFKYESFIDYLTKLSQILEKEKFSFKAISGFRNKWKIYNIIKELEEVFESDLSDDRHKN